MSDKEVRWRPVGVLMAIVVMVIGWALLWTVLPVLQWGGFVVGSVAGITLGMMQAGLGVWLCTLSGRLLARARYGHIEKVEHDDKKERSV